MWSRSKLDTFSYSSTNCRVARPPCLLVNTGELQVSSLNADPHISEIESKKRTS